MDRKSKTGLHKIGLKIRVSTEEQAENPDGSIKNQEERLKATIQFKNTESPFGEIKDIFIDRARSGKDTNRPELQRMLSMIRRHEITLVMVSELSRLSRSIKDFSEIWELMRACGCSFQSLRENFDTTTAAGEMVLYTVANISQFERRQVSERVSAGFQARAARGLYNGGSVPLGYQLIPSKPGYLEVDPEASKTVQNAFKAFMKEGGLSNTARWLNSNGHTVKRETRGGNHRGRLGHFTVENLKWILSDKSYLGVRRYKIRGELKETKAMWPAIIDELTFERVQRQLKSSLRHRKPESENRFPFLLTGFVHCGECGARMVGKSAHGRAGKVPYYEHGWATRREGCLMKKAFSCKPFRVQAKKLEPTVWAEVEKLLRHPKMAEDLIKNAELIHKAKTKSSETKRIQDKISSLGSQLEVLAERLSQIPKSVSPTPVFKQMERIEGLRNEETARLHQFERSEKNRDHPAVFSSYQTLLTGLGKLANDPNATQSRYKIIRSLIHNIKITRDGFNAEFYAGREHVEGELDRLAGSLVPPLGSSLLCGSNSLTNGWLDWD